MGLELSQIPLRAARKQGKRPLLRYACYVATPVPVTPPNVYAWSLSGVLTWSGPLSEFAELHALDPRYLLARLAIAQGTGEPEPIRMSAPGGDLLLTLVPRLWTSTTH